MSVPRGNCLPVIIAFDDAGGGGGGNVTVICASWVAACGSFTFGGSGVGSTAFTYYGIYCGRAGLLAYDNYRFANRYE